MAPDPPLPVSVIIPAYNRPEMVRRAVASAFAQRPRPPAEVIVVDDCSDDDTGAAAADAGARVIRQDRNRGEAGARNTALAHARQPWLGLLDSDDEWLPDLLATLWSLRGEHALVGGASLVCGPDVESYSYAGIVRRKPVVLRSPRSLVFPGNYIAASGTLVRRDVVERVGAWPEGMSRGADMDLWIRVLEQETALIAPTVVTRYHVHAGQVTQDVDALSQAHEAVALQYSTRPWMSDRLLERSRGARYFDAGRRALKNGRRANGARLLWDAGRRPARVTGVAETLWRRFLLRRRTRALPHELAARGIGLGADIALRPAERAAVR